MTRTVVHFTDASAFGGTERVILQLLEHADRDAWRPVLLHHDEPALAPLIEGARSLDVPTHTVPRMLTLRDLGKQRSFIRTLKEIATDVFHAHLFWPLSCKYGLLAAKRAAIPAILATAHVRYDLSHRPLLRCQPRLIARLVDRYLAVSQGVADQLRSDFRIPREKVAVIPNGVDLKRCCAERDEALRSTLVGGTDKPIVLTAARLAEQKGHRDLIDAAARIDDAIFVFAGDGPLRSELEHHVNQLSLADRVRFLGSRDDVPRLLACADLFVLPSLYEGMPLSLLEAMAAQIPIIATDIPGNNELIADAQTGALVPPNSPDALASAIQTALDNPQETRSWAESAYACVTKRHDLRRVVKQVEDIYLQCLRPSRSPEPTA